MGIQWGYILYGSLWVLVANDDNSLVSHMIPVMTGIGFRWLAQPMGCGFSVKLRDRRIDLFVPERTYINNYIQIWLWVKLGDKPLHEYDQRTLWLCYSLPTKFELGERPEIWYTPSLPKGERWLMNRSQSGVITKNHSWGSCDLPIWDQIRTTLPSGNLI